MLIKLMIKNLRYYIKNYFIYILSIAFNAWVYTLFSMFVNSSIGMGFMAQKTYGVLLNIASTTILLFTLFFAYYSITFFSRKRSREIGIYLLSGVNRGKVGILFYLETIIIGMVGVILGCMIGMIMKGPLMSYAYGLIYDTPKIMVSNMSIFCNVLIRFLLIFMVIGISNINMALRFKLVELFKKDSVEDTTVKISILKIIFSTLVVIIGYVMIFNVKGSETILYMPVGLMLILVGMFLTFNQIITGLCLYLRKTDLVFRNFVWRVNLSTLLHRINKNSFLLTMVSILISVSISLTTLGFAIEKNISYINQKVHPFTYMYVSKDSDNDRIVDEIIEKSGLKKLKRSIEYISSGYHIDNYSNTDEGSNIRIIKSSDLTKLSRDNKVNYNKKIGKGGCVVLSGYHKKVGDDLQLSVNNKKVDFKIEGITQYNPVVLDDEQESIAISDEDFEKIASRDNLKRLQCYDVREDKNIDDLGMKILNIIDKNSKINFTTNEDVFVMRLTKIIILIIILISISLISSVGSMLYFWILSEIRSQDRNYKILYSIGADKFHLKKVLSNQIGMLFVIPYIVSSINIILMTVFLYKKNLVSNLEPTLFGVLIYSLFYIVYYFFTYITSVNMVGEIKRGESL